MRSTTLFGVYAGILIALVGGLAGLMLYSLDKTRWWDERIMLAQESYGLHLRLEADLYRLFKQHGDALLIGDRDRGERERALREAIEQNLLNIRDVIDREVAMVGAEEIEEFELLDAIEQDIRAVNDAIATLSASGDPIDTFIQIERLAALLDGDIDDKLDRKIAAALAGELEEVEEVVSAAAAFRDWNERLVYIILVITVVTLIIGLLSFNAQIRNPIIRLKRGIDQLRQAQYTEPVYLGGSREFRDLGGILNQMADGLAAREASRAEQRKQLEETVATRTAELQQLIRKLENGEENRKQLMADISHELRTPLAIILGEADVTLRTSTTLSNEVSDSMARIRESAKHTNQIVDDMLTVARVEAGQLRLDRKETDLRKVIHDANAMFPREVHIDTPDIPVPAHVDEVRLRQSVLALLQNARRYGGPTISVTLRDTAHAQIIAVEDDGPGLSAAEKAQAFDRFFRGSNTSGQGSEGSGLGLPVVKSIVEAHNGAVDLHDRDAGGLGVVITLPKAPPPAADGAR
ncbi:HAMP domain-containing sensor histidine kinase [uncultured Tateyamaria sp.]|uniref:sensor histidine kinase n=1 Tax=Tateyamaria sp. 1078 TaxID=3417464 RepID=UPI0026380F52|nr:HAMP domain-containing sensor histidine kinase [uncultured Tateyamaria sp.]